MPDASIRRVRMSVVRYFRTAYTGSVGTMGDAVMLLNSDTSGTLP